MLEICSLDSLAIKTSNDRHKGALTLFSSFKVRSQIEVGLDDSSLVKVCLGGDKRAYEVLLRLSKARLQRALSDGAFA